MEITVAQKIYYIRESHGFVQCYVEQQDHFVLSWQMREGSADKKMAHLTMIYRISGRGIYDGIYIRNGSTSNLSFLFMLKIMDRLGVNRCLNKVAPPDKSAVDIFMSIANNGVVTFYKGSSGILNVIGVYTDEQFLAVKRQYTHAYRSGDYGLYLRNNHLAKLAREKVNNDARKKGSLTQTP